MRAAHACFGLLGTLALTVLPAPAGAQPVGDEFQVNTYTTGNQRTQGPGHLIGADASGNFVVVWQGPPRAGGFGAAIFGQRFDSSGEMLGAEFAVDSSATGGQWLPSVAMAANGDFVVVWSSLRQNRSEYDIFGQRYDRAGVPHGDVFRVNSHTRSQQFSPVVAADTGGNFVVVWESRNQDGSNQGVFGQRFDSGGVPRGAEFRVNSYTTGWQYHPSVSSDADGNFVVVWQSFGQDGDGPGVFGQRYDSAGGARGREFLVNSYTTSGQYLPSVALAESGSFVVVWSSRYQDSGGQGIFGQRYDSEGAAQGNEFRINSFTTFAELSPSVAAAVDGDFVVVWERFDHPNSKRSIFGRRYDSDGVAQGDEFQVNSFTTGVKMNPAVATTGPSRFVAVWESGDQDGDQLGVFGQRFDFGGDSITVESPNRKRGLPDRARP